MPFKSNTINLRLHRPAAPSEESATSTAKVASSIALSCYYSTNGTPPQSARSGCQLPHWGAKDV